MSRKPLDPIPPGEILREEFMRPLGITATGLARDIGVPANRISQIVNGKRALSADTALRLGKYFGMSPEIWLDLQSEYDLRLARRTTWKQIEPRVRKRVA
jgi:addiction module HigA family antidote